jgi:hypothetical protein
MRRKGERKKENEKEDSENLEKALQNIRMFSYLEMENV